MYRTTHRQIAKSRPLPLSFLSRQPRPTHSQQPYPFPSPSLLLSHHPEQASSTSMAPLVPFLCVFHSSPTAKSSSRQPCSLGPVQASPCAARSGPARGARPAACAASQPRDPRARLVVAARPTPAAAAPPLRPPSLAGSRWWRRTSSPARCAKGRGAKQGRPAGRGGGGADGRPRRRPARRRVTPAGGERVLPRVPAASGGPRAVSALLRYVSK